MYSFQVLSKHSQWQTAECAIQRNCGQRKHQGVVVKSHYNAYRCVAHNRTKQACGKNAKLNQAVNKLYEFRKGVKRIIEFHLPNQGERLKG